MLTESVSKPVVAAASAFENRLEPWLRWVAFGAAASIILSIAISQMLLGVGLVLLFLTRKRLEFPPVLLPLSLFLAWTVAGGFAFRATRLKGLPQIRKFFVFGIILLVFNGFRGVPIIRNLFWAWAGGATISAIFAIYQFFARWREAVEIHAQRYDYVLDGRIKGLAGHWMTFGGEGMIALLALLALLLFSDLIEPVQKAVGWLCAAVLWTALVMGYTRSIFLLGLPAGALVLAWYRQRWLILVIPIVAVATFAAAPPRCAGTRDVRTAPARGRGFQRRAAAIMARTGAHDLVASVVWAGAGGNRSAIHYIRPGGCSEAVAEGMVWPLAQHLLAICGGAGAAGTCFFVVDDRENDGAISIPLCAEQQPKTDLCCAARWR